MPIIITAEIALITGETPNLIIEYMCKGKVLEPGPETKKVITKSSRESVIDIRNPAIIPGTEIGIITFRRV